MEQCATASRVSSRPEGTSVWRHFFWVAFKEPQPAVDDVLGLIEAIVQLYGSDEKIDVDDKSKVALRRRFECTLDRCTVVASGDRRHDIELVVGAIKKLNGCPRMGSGSGILQNLKQWEIENNFPVA